MKKLTTGLALGFLCGAAGAAPVALPDGAITIHYANFEQVSVTNAIPTPSGGHEGNWGIVRVSHIVAEGTNALLFTAGASEIVGMFYGLDVIASADGLPLAQSGGTLDIYFRDSPLPTATPTPGDRTGDASYAGYTDGTLLARLRFASGIAADATVTTALLGVGPGGEAIFGGYADVTDIDGNGVIDFQDGAWAPALDTDSFVTASGSLRDFLFQQIVVPLPAWHDPGFGVTSDIFGALSNDPLRGFVSNPVPVPGAFGSAALGLCILVLWRRRAG